MFVLIDLEWITDKENIDHLTQLSAVRTTKKWDVVDHFDKLCSLPDGSYPTDHVALSGYDICDFSSSPSMAEVIQQFADWLNDDDILLFWHNSSWMRLAEFTCRFSVVLPSREKRILGERIRKHYGKEHGSAYEICYAKNIDVPAPEHCSIIDVCAILMLLLDSGMNLSSSAAPIPQLPTRPAADRREKNKEIISRTEYNYLFAAGASVFHKRGCPCMLNAKIVLGSVYYETAANSRAAYMLSRWTLLFWKKAASLP